MAVYKATHCYPLTNSLDIRVVADQQTLTPCIWLKCQVDTSNKQVTGYKIRVFDTLNRQIFPANNFEGKISPIEELKGISEGSSLYIDTYTNSGLNGTMLNIPFFQNYYYSDNPDYSNRKLTSYNAIYYKPKYQACYASELSGWTLEQENTELTPPDGWDGTIDGEILMANDTVLCIDSSDTNKVGIWQIDSANGILKRYKDINGQTINIEKLINNYCVIGQGTRHNYVYAFDSEGACTEYSTPDNPANDLWVDVQGNALGIDLNEATYKWEIILYQGEGEKVGDDPLFEMDYSNLSFDWFDLVLTSGTILGSTNKRIQIASANDETGILPEGTALMPIVLQGKYVQLYSYENGTEYMLGKRVYIQTYDATFGHIYPLNGKFTMEDIKNASYVRCFKYSNDPDYILASDRVTVATTENLHLWDGDEPYINTDLPVIDGYQVREGDLVLVKNQTNAKENGVYVAKPVGTYWPRSGSYRKWADFMGKILYVEQGNTNGGNNFQASAQTFGTIFNPSQGDTGDSPLYFIIEQPITLFSAKITDTVDYVSLLNDAPGEWRVASNYPLDGYIVNETFIGQTFYHWKGRKIYKITEYNNGSFRCQVVKDLTPATSDNDVVYITYGEHWSAKSIQVGSSTGSSPVVDDTPNKAVVLKNSQNKTFISPYLNLDVNMALKLQNNVKIFYEKNGVNVPTEYIRITAAPNKKLWYIEHDDYYATRDSSTPLIFESMSESDPTIPYKYDICTYYKASDENPFYTYEKPYLKLIGEIGEHRFSDVIFDPEYNIMNVTKRYVKFSGEYRQFQHASWESYRWILKNYNKEIVQDTGYKYNKNIETVFYGLSNDGENNSNRYSVELTVIDARRNTLTYEATVVVKPRDPIYYGELSSDHKIFTDKEGHILTPESGPLYLEINERSYYKYDFDQEEYVYVSKAVEFTANFDCDTHTVVLNYQDNVFVLPSEFFQEEDIAIKPVIGSDYDIGSNGTAYIRDIAGGENYVNSITNSLDAVSSFVPLTNINVSNNYGLSRRVQKGFEFAHYYTADQSASTDPATLILSPNSQNLVVLGDQAYFETKIRLNENYCGEILHYYLEGEAEGQEIGFILSTNDNFSGGFTKEHISSDRNLIKLQLDFDNGQSVSIIDTKVSETFKLFTAKNDIRYILQPVNSVSSNYEYHQYTDDGNLFYYMKMNSSTGEIEGVYNSEKSLGNCCLEIANENRETMYWVEDVTLSYTTEGIIKNNAGINLLLANEEPSWPGAEDEENFFWTEEVETGMSYPNYYASLIRGDFSSGAYFHKFYAMPRHPFSAIDPQSNLLIKIEIDQITAFCHDITTAGMVKIDVEGQETESVVTFKIYSNTETYGHVSIQKDNGNS